MIYEVTWTANGGVKIEANSWQEAADKVNEMTLAAILDTYGHANGPIVTDSIEVEPPLDSRDPDHSRTGIFVYHNCHRCRDGADLSRCPTPNAPGNCGEPIARND